MKHSANPVQVKNLGLTERWASILGGAALVSAGVKKGSKGGTLFAILGGDLIYSGTPENVGPVVKGDVLLCKLEGLPDMSIRIV